MAVKPNVKRLRKAMIDKDINTITELAKQSGVSRPKIHEFFREETPLSNTFLRLCEFLEVDPADVVINEKDGDIIE